MALTSLNIPDWLLGTGEDCTVATALPAALLAVSETMGSDTEALLRAAGIRASELREADSRISYRAFLRLCGAALEEQPVAALCLQFGQRLNISALGALGLGLLSCTTGREAFELAIEYRSTLGVPTDVHLDIGQREATLVFDEPYKSLISTRYLKAKFYTIIGCHFHNARYLIGDTFRFERICLDFEASPDDKILADHFGCDVVPGSKENCVVFNRKWLDAPIQYATPWARKITHSECQRLSTRLRRRRSVSQRVAKLLLRHLQTPPSLSDVASQFGISSRSLSRQLLSEGLSFQVLLDELRKTNAELLLREHELSVEKVAQAVGFSDVANFRRAFKKWTNITPARYRDNCRSAKTART